MAYCAQCGTDIGEAGSCPSCGVARSIQAPPPAAPSEAQPGPASTGQPSVSQQPAPIAQPNAYQQPAPTAQPQPAPTGQPIPHQQYAPQPAPNQYYAPQPVYNQQASYAPYGKAVAQKVNPLIYVAGVVLIVLAVYMAAESIMNIVGFLSIFSNDSLSMVTMNMFPWLPVIYSIIVDIVLIVTGVFTLLFAKKANRALILVIAAGLSCIMQLIVLIGSFADFISTAIRFGSDFFNAQSHVFFNLIPVPYVVNYLFGMAVDLFALWAAIALLICALIARKRSAR